jgi:hypothetical protein
LRLQRQARRLNVPLGYPACLDCRQYSGHLFGICFAGLARGLLQAAHSDADNRGVGRTETVASPVTVTALSAACAVENASMAVSKIGRKRDSVITSQVQIR